MNHDSCPLGAHRLVGTQMCRATWRERAKEILLEGVMPELKAEGPVQVRQMPCSHSEV